MKNSYAIIFLASGTLGSFLNRAICNADNCARAVAGTRYALSVQASHIADCSSFMIQTVTPAASTATITVTATSYSVIGSNAKRTAIPQIGKIAARDEKLDAILLPPTSTPAVKVRQLTQNPSIVPVYATACSSTVRYSSACSCAGINQATVLELPPAVVTSTIYAAASIIPVCDPAQNFGYKKSGGSFQAGVKLSVGRLPLSPEACCAACFVDGSACFIYQYAGFGCQIVTVVGGSSTPTDYCPYGVFSITNPHSGSLFGSGPCATLV